MEETICSLSAAFVGVISFQFLSQTDKTHISKSLRIQKLFKGTGSLFEENSSPQHMAYFSLTALQPWNHVLSMETSFNRTIAFRSIP